MSDLAGAWNIAKGCMKVIAVLTIAFFGSAFIAAIVEVARGNGGATASNSDGEADPATLSSAQTETWTVTDEAAKSTTDHSQSTKQTVWNEQSKDSVRSPLKDGNSARIRNVRFSDVSGTPVTCGEVNAKNTFGGYRGYQGFIAGGPNRSLVFLEEKVTGFAVAKQKLCDG